MASKPYAVVMAMRIRDQATRGVNRVTQSVTKLRQRMAFRARNLGWHRVTNQVRNLGMQLGGAANRVRQFASRWVAMGAAAAAGGLVAMVSRLSAVGDATAKMAARVGLGVERLQELQFAGERYGASQEDVNNSVRALSKSIGEAANGTGEAGPMFKALGISLLDANGKIKATDVVLGEVADKMAMIPDAASRVAVAQKLMEDGGVRLIPLLAKGSGEIARMAAEAQRLGVINTTTSKRMEAFSDKMLNARQAVTGIGAAITGKLLPYLNPLIESFGNWVAASRDLIASRVEGLVSNIAAAVRSIDWSAQAAQVGGFVDRIGQVIDFIGGWKRALFVIGGVMASHLITPVVRAGWSLGVLAGKLVLATTKTALFIAAQQGKAIFSFFTSLRFGVGIVKSLNIAMRANPIGFIVTAVQVLAGLGSVLYGSFRPFRDLIDGIWTRIRALIAGAGKWAAKTLGINIDAFRSSPSPSSSPPTQQVEMPLQTPSASRPLPPQASMPPPAMRGSAAVRVVFENAPPGMRVSQDGPASDGLKLETHVNVGPNLVGAY